MNPALAASVAGVAARAVDAPLRVQSAGDGLIRHLAGLLADTQTAHRQGLAQQIAAQVPAAVRQHPEFAAAQALGQYSAEAVNAAEAAWWPQVYGNSSAGRRRVDGVKNHHPTVGLGVNQLLYDFGATSAQVGAAQAGVKASEAALRARYAALTMRAVTAWHELYRARQHLELQRLNVSSRREIAEFVKERADLGGSSMSDVLRARARQAEAEASIAGAEARLQVAEAAWREVFATVPPAALEIAAQGAVTLTPYRQDRVSLARRFAAVDEKFAQATAARREADAASAARFPRLALDVSTAKEVGGIHPADQSALLQVKYNFYTGGAETAKAAQALAKAAQAEAEARNEQLQTEKALLQVIAEVESAPLALAARQQAVWVAGDSLVAVREQFAFRRGTLLDLLRAQEDVYYAGRDLIDALADAALARYRLQYLASEFN